MPLRPETLRRLDLLDNHHIERIKSELVDCPPERVHETVKRIELETRAEKQRIFEEADSPL